MPVTLNTGGPEESHHTATLPDVPTAQEITQAIERLFPTGKGSGDHEGDHLQQDTLYVHVLRAIASGRYPIRKDAEHAAAAVLAVERIRFTR